MRVAGLEIVRLYILLGPELPYRCCMLTCGIVAVNCIHWKTQAWMTPGAKFDLTPENNLFLTPEEFGRRGQFYFGLSAFEGFEFTDAFTG